MNLPTMVILRGSWYVFNTPLVIDVPISFSQHLISTTKMRSMGRLSHYQHLGAVSFLILDSYDPVKKFTGSDNLGPPNDAMTQDSNNTCFRSIYSHKQFLLCDMQGM